MSKVKGKQGTTVRNLILHGIDQLGKPPGNPGKLEMFAIMGLISQALQKVLRDDEYFFAIVDHDRVARYWLEMSAEATRHLAQTYGLEGALEAVQKKAAQAPTEDEAPHIEHVVKIGLQRIGNRTVADIRGDYGKLERVDRLAMLFAVAASVARDEDTSIKDLLEFAAETFVVD